MPTCDWCETETRQYIVEVAWIDTMDDTNSHVETYCSTRCLRAVMMKGA